MIIWIDDTKLNEVQNALLEKELDFSIMKDSYFSIHGLWLRHVIEQEGNKSPFDKSDRYKTLAQKIPFLEESVIEKITYNDESRKLVDKMYDFYKKILLENLEAFQSIEE